MSRIAIDAMGGDKGPREVVLGTVQAHEKYPDIELILVGRAEELEPLLAEHGDKAKGIKVVHASEVVSMEDSPMDAIRGKKDSSVNRSVNLVATGQADAIMSPGNTGAVVASATFQLRLLKGVRRPGIAVSIPTSRGVTMVIDVGANVYPKPEHLCQYAAMAGVYSHLIWNVEKPRVGLLNIGSENAKGTGLVRQVHEQLSRSNLNFVGNLEGYDLWDGNYDVIVCEGFVGNVLLKVSEGLWPALLKQVSKSLKKHMGESAGEWTKAISELLTRYDYAEYGGAPLLGVNGICIICHGSSEAKAFMNAIRLANDCVGMALNKCMQEAVHAAGFDQAGEGSTA
jgi:phosphate acyltransferase